MARICPEPTLPSWRLLFSEMDALSRPYAFLAGKQAALALLDLTHVTRLLDTEATHNAPSGLEELLAPDERRFLDRLTLPKRRREWLGGRLAAKYCLQQLLGESRLSGCAILPGAQGQPLPQCGAGPCPCHISLSHSDGYAAAVAARSNCGIDIQRKTKKLLAVQERFARPEECALLERLADPLTGLALLWAAKEAVKKRLLARDGSVFSALTLEEAACDAENTSWTARLRLGKGPVAIAGIRAVFFYDYVLACTVEEHDA